MNAWGIAMICLLSVDVGISLAKHGERKPNYNFPVAVVSAVLYVWIAYHAGMWQLAQ